MTDPIRDAEDVALRDAFVAGFKASGEGWNGEYPFSDKGLDPAASEDLREEFDYWRTHIDGSGCAT